jgi:hypothetical protein
MFVDDDVKMFCFRSGDRGVKMGRAARVGLSR